MFRMQLFLGLSFLLINACSDGGSGFDSGIPSSREVIESASPTGLTSGASSSLSTLGNCALQPTSNSADIISCFKSKIFKNYANDEERNQLPIVNYIKHVGEVDARISNLEKRFDVAPDCLLTGAAVPVDISIPFGGQTVTETVHLQCWEVHTVPTADDYQDMAMGKSGNHWYLVLRTRNNNYSGRVLVGKISLDGLSVSSWLFSWSDFDQDGTLDAPGSGEAGSDDVSVIRSLANKTTKSFTMTFSSANYASSDLGHIFMRSNGTDVQFSDLTLTNPAGFAAVTPFVNGGCVSFSDVSLPGSDCTSLTGAPTDYGLALVPVSADMDATAMAAVKALFSMDYTAAGVPTMVPAGEEN